MGWQIGFFFVLFLPALQIVFIVFMVNNFLHHKLVSYFLLPKFVSQVQQVIQIKSW